MNTFPEEWQFNLGYFVELIIKWLLANFQFVFDGIWTVVFFILYNTQNFLLWLPWWAFIAIVLLITWWLLGNIITMISFALLLILIGTFGLWDLTMLTLALVVTAVIISLILGIPIGIIMAYSARVQQIVKPILDAMQTMPSFVYLIPAVLFFGLGTVSAVFAVIIYAIPPVIRLTNLAIREVSQEMVEAGYSFGSSNWQVLRKIQLPQALPTIMTGINQTIMMALAMVVIASMIGAEGLGMEVLLAMNRTQIDMGFEAGLAIVIIAIIIDRLSQGIPEKFRS